MKSYFHYVMRFVIADFEIGNILKLLLRKLNNILIQTCNVRDVPISKPVLYNIVPFDMFYYIIRKENNEATRI